MRTKIALSLCLLLAVGGTIVTAADNATASPQTVTVDKATLDRLVQEEVQRQLPALVQAEVQRQMEGRAQQTMRNGRALSTMSTLQTIRSQLELYKIQHNDQFPAIAELASWKALTQKTDTDGAYSPKGMFGPYVQAAPANPFTGKTHIAAAGSATADDGWSWDAQKEAFRVVLSKADATVFLAAGSARDADSVEIVGSATTSAMPAGLP